MADTYSILIQPGTVRISRTADNSTIFSTDYNYLHYDTSGSINWPVGPTMSSSGGNLTWQFNGQQVVINNSYYPAGAKSFDTYKIPLAALNPTITSDNFQDIVTRNVEYTGTSK